MIFTGNSEASKKNTVRTCTPF